MAVHELVEVKIRQSVHNDCQFHLLDMQDSDGLGEKTQSFVDILGKSKLERWQGKEVPLSAISTFIAFFS